MGKKLNIAHNLSDVELEEALEKALKGLRKHIEEPNRAFPDALANKIKSEGTDVFDKVIANMIEEIKSVIKGVE